ncbi:MAG TPA: TetR/AcrR family transcriptional regulator [Polyangiaceae bacterium]
MSRASAPSARAKPRSRSRAPGRATPELPEAAPTKPESKRLDAYSIRSRIIGKAAGVFGKLGAADSTVEDILKAAEVSRRTFYKFFQSKEDVLDALHEIGCNMLIGAARQVAAMPGAPLERVERGIDGYLQYHLSVGTDVMYVVQGESMRVGSKLGARRRAFLDTIVDLLNDELKKVSGERVDPLLLRSLLVSVEGVSMMLRAESSENPIGAFDLERAKRIMLRLVMATMAAPAGALVPPLPAWRGVAARKVR